MRFLIPVLLALLPVPQDQQLPNLYRSKHYDLQTSATKEQAQELLEYMELVFDTYLKLLKPDNIAVAERSRSTIILYKDREEFIAGGAPPGAGAYYNIQSKNLVGFYDEELMKPFFAHEGMHQFTDLTSKNFRDFPMWFSEGIADCIGNNEVRDKKLYLCIRGGPIARMRLGYIQEALRINKAYKLKDLLGLGRQAFMQNAGLCYAQSWSFCHFLIAYPDHEDRRVQIPNGKYRKNLSIYYERIRLGGSTHEKAWAEAFRGIPIEKLEAEWKKYVETFENDRLLGFTGEELDAKAASEVGIQEGSSGIRVLELNPDGVGAKAGLAVGDVILSFDGRAIPDTEPIKQLREWIEAVGPGKKVVVVVRRAGKDVNLTVTWDPPKKR
jgi:hypothetical protein